MTNTQRKINTAQNAANDSRKAPFERSLYEYTSALRVPWQETNFLLKVLYLLGFEQYSIGF